MEQQPQSMFTEAIAAARAGDYVRARDLLTRLMRVDPTNAEYWVWMSAVVKSERQRVYCLQSALQFDPTNRAALRGLLIVDERKPEAAEISHATPIPRRRVQKRRSSGLFKAKNLARLALISMALFFFAGLIFLFGLWRARPAGVAPALPTLEPTEPIVTPSPAPPTNTPLPAATRIFRTPIPTDLAETPIAFFVEIKPTPTQCLYITSDSHYEAFNSAISAFAQDDYEAAIEFINQVIELDPSMADAYYIKGEALRLAGQSRDAIDVFNIALKLNPENAYYYLSRARAQLQWRPTRLPEDFDNAIEIDPLLADAYLEKAQYYASERVWGAAEDCLLAAVEAGVTAPLVYIRLSEAQYTNMKYEDALENAMEGSANDPALLDGYLALGRVLAKLERYEDATYPLQTYVAYRGDDHRGRATLGRAWLELGYLDAAQIELNQALMIKDNYAPAYLARGLLRIEQGDYAAGLEDLYDARRYGPETNELSFAFGRALYLLGDYVNALKYINKVMASTINSKTLAECYALKALIYELTNPPLIQDAIVHWNWVLSTEGALPETRALAIEHLEALTGATETPAPTPSPSATPTIIQP